MKKVKWKMRVGKFVMISGRTVLRISCVILVACVSFTLFQSLTKVDVVRTSEQVSIQPIVLDNQEQMKIVTKSNEDCEDTYFIDDIPKEQSTSEPELNNSKLYIEIGLDYQYQDLTREVIELLELDTDEYFFYGMMYTESRFRVLAESYAGAQGIMQIMPTTWDFYYSQFCKEYPEFSETICNDILDIRSNITIGVYIISQISKDCGVSISQDPHRVLSSYNRGICGANKYYKSNGTYTTTYSTEILRAAEYIRVNKTWKEGL